MILSKSSIVLFFILIYDNDIEKRDMMNLQIGTQLRAFRLKCNMTQEQLADQLNVTSQTISKWENGLSYPDILLLPELTAILGMTLDELFQTTSNTHLKRIEQMLNHDLSDKDFEYAERELQNALLCPETKSDALTLLSSLYLHQSEFYRNKALTYAKEALETDPYKKENHSLLNIASNAHVWDWCETHHSDYIEYYKRFTEKHPQYSMGYEWLICNLIHDYRLSEAEELLHKMKPLQDHCHYLLYQGWIYHKAGKHQEASYIWDSMLKEDDWLSYSFRADVHASLAEYDKAILCYKKAAELEPSPKYTDNWISIAHINQILGNPNEAIQAYQKVLFILKDDYHLTEGYEVDRIKNEISKLR